MQRLTDWWYATEIEFARSLIPDAILDRLSRVDFLTGIDPTYAGLHDYASEVRHFKDGRSFALSEMAHCG